MRPAARTLLTLAVLAASTIVGVARPPVPAPPPPPRTTEKLGVLFYDRRHRCWRVLHNGGVSVGFWHAPRRPRVHRPTRRVHARLRRVVSALRGVL